MEKKEYIEPKMEVIVLEHRESLLEASLPDDIPVILPKS